MKKVEKKKYLCGCCGETLYRLESQVGKIPYCSRKCYWDSKKGSTPHNKGVREVSSKPCAVCGSNIEGERSVVERRKYCSSACAGRARKLQTGSNNLKKYIQQRIRLTKAGCWEWKLSTNRGYARFRVEGESVYGHRAVYEEYVGPIPEGMFLDHLCRNRACLNPEHLEPVTAAENIRRGVAGYREKTPQERRKRSESLKKYYSDPKNRAKQAKVLEKVRRSTKRIESLRKLHRSEEYRSAQSARIKEYWRRKKEGLV